MFGCACWPYLRPYNNWKLEFHSKQCVFHGYSPMHKGVKCLDIHTSRVYISRDVIFDENIFPFTNLHSNAGARLRSEITLLPPALLNPNIPDQGGEIIDDHVANDTNPTTNGSGSYSVENHAGNNHEMPRTEVLEPGSQTEEDVVVTSGAAAARESALGLVTTDTPRQDHLPHTNQPSSATWQISALGHDTRDSVGPSELLHAESLPSAAPRVKETEGAGPTESAPMIIIDQGRSSAATNDQITRPKTRLQSEIRKQKVYTDGTIKYGCFTSTGEP
jgi:hypothetical protein